MIRRAALEDVPALAAIEAASAHAPWSADALAGSLATPTCTAWLAGEPPVGHAVATAVAGEGELLTLAVLPEARRRRIASALLEELVGWWRAQAVERAFLEVRADNHPALALYERTGWRRTGIRPRYYRDGADAVLMELAP
ncbi:MAG: ribosomal protein S18-alanine N-acetyltransferase [Alphaproteobacteria bacterium]|nr:ribosomal protein S18-alanine N-acetyltransferase [Alphaproteobacteria bacterium]